MIRKANINLWENKKQEYANYQTEIENIKQQIAKRKAELGTDASVKSDEMLLELTDRQNELTVEAENIMDQIKSIETNISEFLESTPTQLGLNEYVDSVLAKVNNPNASLNDLYSALEDVVNYYTTLKESGILSDNDVVLNNVLAKLSEAFNSESKIDIRGSDQGQFLASKVLDFLEKSGANESDLETAVSIIGSAFSGEGFQNVKNTVKNYYSELGSGRIDKINDSRNLISDALNTVFDKISENSSIKSYIENNQDTFNN